MIDSIQDQGAAPTARDVMGFLRRRRGIFFGLAAPIAIAAVLLAFKLPPVYQSQAKILIEQPSIPEDIVMSTVTSYVEERIQKVSQRALSTDNVVPILDEFGLYEEDRRTAGEQVAIDLFRQDTLLENIATEVFDAKRGRMDGSTFAFLVGYRTSNPIVSQQVTARLAELYLTENVKSRTEKSAETTRFLEQQRERIAADISQIEKRISEFKSQYTDALPERAFMNVAALERTERELDDVEQRIRELRSERDLLQAELQGIKPHATVMDSTGSAVLSVEERLEMLRLEYMRLSAAYGPEHPDVLRTKREIDAIIGDSPGQSREYLEQQLASLQLQRKELLDRYSPEHPDITRIERSISIVQSELDSIGTVSVAMPVRSQSPTNPLYVQQQVRINAAIAGIRDAESNRRRLLERRDDLERNMTMSPQIEKELLELNRGYDSAREDFDEINAKISEARMSESLEEQNKGERFVLLERASLPSQPIEPNRTAILLLGIVLGIGAGVGMAALTDGLDTSVRGRHDLELAIAPIPLVAVPFVDTFEDRRKRWIRRLSATGAVAASIFFIFTWV